MELFVLLALVLLGLSVLVRRRSYTPGAPAAAAAIQKISDPALAHRALVENADEFSNRPLAPFLRFLAESQGGRPADSVVSVPYGPVWRAFRCNLTAETLHPSRLVHIAPLQREAIHDLVDALALSASAGQGAVAVREHLDAAVFAVVARLCFGESLDERHAHSMRSAIVEFQQGAVGELRPSPASLRARLAEWRRVRRLLALHGRLGELFLPLIAARRELPRPRDDGGRRPYVDALIDLRVPVDGEDGSRRAATNNDMVNLVLEFLAAGTQTTVACLEFILANLVNRQQVQLKLREEVDRGGDFLSRSLIRDMPYLNAVLLESLRLYPVVPFTQRHVNADTAARVLGGTAALPLAAGGVSVQFTVGDIGRDKKKWKDPEEFRPERFLPGGEGEDVGPLPGLKEMKMMPFGAGHRFCPGNGLAIMNIKCFLAALVREFEWSLPTEDCAEVDLAGVGTFVRTMKKPLSAILTRRT